MMHDQTIDSLNVQRQLMESDATLAPVLKLLDKGRVDIHVLFWMISVGNVPIYIDRQGSRFSVSNTYHSTRKGPIRAGVP